MTGERIERLALHGGAAAVSAGAIVQAAPPTEATAAVQDALRDGTWCRYHGPWSGKLMESLAEYHQLAHVRLCASGTVAVELALKGIGVGPGDEVVLAGYDFPGNFRCIEHVGARPVLVDICAATGCLNAGCLDAAWSDRTRALLVSHLHGGVANMKTIRDWAHARDVAVVEDACQSPGGLVDGQLAGTWGDVSTLSFGGSKLLAAGRGGAVLTADEGVFQRMKVYSERGNDAYPLSELQAAAVLPQLATLGKRNQTRQRSAKMLFHGTRDVRGIQWCGQPPETPNVAASYYKLAWRVDPDQARDDWINALRAEGVPIDVGFRGFARRSSRRCEHVGDLANAKVAAERCLLLHHPLLLSSDTALEQVVTAFRKVAYWLNSTGAD